MAGLLGGEYCIDSLRRDVKDLQGILDEVHSRVGQVRYQSWKFPDKASCDIDVRQLLERCQYNETDEEECQMSHVMLYDMVIDRLVYLLQSFACFNEILLNVETGAIQTSPSALTKKSSSSKSMSIGLTVKKCWSRITQIAALLQKLAKEVNSCSMAFKMTKEKEGSEQALKTSKLSSSHDTLKQERGSFSASDEKDVSCDNRSTGCQTAESSYTSCETCLRTQNCLHDVGRSVVELCKAQNLPTALEDYQTRFNESIPMSVAEIVRWAKHQTKDLSRVSRHMTSLVNQVTPLKADLAAAVKNENKAKSDLQVCQSVYDRKEEELREEFRRREYRLKEVEKDLKKKIATLENIKAEMQEEINKCQWKISDLKDELLQKHRDQLSMENSISQLKEEAVEGRQYKQDALKFKSDLSRVTSDLENLQKSFHHDKKLYESELAKNENMEHHEKMLHEKQKTLVAKMEAINEECEKLRDNILTLEDERDAVLAKLDVLEKNQSDEEKTSQQYQSLHDLHQNEMEVLRKNISMLKRENEELKSAVDDYGERERLLVAYPDLNQPTVSSPMVQGSGDVIADMRNQIEANKIRIQVLEKEDDALLKTLQKLRSSRGDATKNQRRLSPENTSPVNLMNSSAHIKSIHGQFPGTVQLWNMSNSECMEDQRYGEDRGHEGSQSLYQKFSPGLHNSSLKPPSGRCTHAVDAPNNPLRQLDAPNKNGTRFGNDTSTYSSSSFEAYKKIKQQAMNSSQSRSTFTVGSGRRTKSGRPSSAKSAMFKPWM